MAEKIVGVNNISITIWADSGHLRRCGNVRIKFQSVSFWWLTKKENPIVLGNIRLVNE